MGRSGTYKTVRPRHTWVKRHPADMDYFNLSLLSIYGLLSGCIVWLITIIATFPFSGLTVIIFPIFMWFSLRWLEDCLSSLRAAIALISMLAIGKKRLREIRRMRQLLVERVTRVAVERAELPDDVEVFVKDAAAKERRNREKGGKVGRLGYFSLRRRRKKDYNEVSWFYINSKTHQRYGI